MARLLKLGLLMGVLTFVLAGAAYAITTSTSDVGTSGNDTLNGDAQANYIEGLEGNDLINGRGGNDSLSGGPDRDDLTGAGGDDYLTGGDGRDILDGGAGNDTINAADAERDVVFCGPGQDVVFADAQDGTNQCEKVYLRDASTPR